MGPQCVLNSENLLEKRTMSTMHIFGILRLWGFQNAQFCPNPRKEWCLVTLYIFFYYINSKFLLHKDFFSHHKHCLGWSLCIIKFIFQAKIRPKILAIFAQKWVFAGKQHFGLEIEIQHWNFIMQRDPGEHFLLHRKKCLCSENFEFI